MALNFPDTWGVKKGWNTRKFEIGDTVIVTQHPTHDLGYTPSSVGRYVGKKSVIEKIMQHKGYGNLAFIRLYDYADDTGIYFHFDDLEKVR